MLTSSLGRKGINFPWIVSSQMFEKKDQGTNIGQIKHVLYYWKAP
jgi:hypothetical protein